MIDYATARTLTRTRNYHDADDDDLDDNAVESESMGVHFRGVRVPWPRIARMLDGLREDQRLCPVTVGVTDYDALMEIYGEDIEALYPGEQRRFVVFADPEDNYAISPQEHEDADLGYRALAEWLTTLGAPFDVLAEVGEVPLEIDAGWAEAHGIHTDEDDDLADDDEDHDLDDEDEDDDDEPVWVGGCPPWPREGAIASGDPPDALVQPESAPSCASTAALSHVHAPPSRSSPRFCLWSGMGTLSGSRERQKGVRVAVV